MRQVTFKDRQADRSAARLPLGDIFGSVHFNVHSKLRGGAGLQTHL